jgi:isopenicillin-N N-acyltransferase-like protein
MLPLVEIDSPEPRERGRQYGEQARAQIGVSVDFYKAEFELRSGLTWAEVRERAPRWVPLIEAYHPDALEEVRGVAEGSGFAVEEILALNGRGELRIRNADPFETDGCTSFALTADGAGDGHVYCGQNWDWRVGTKESVVMLRVKQEPKPTIVMQVEAGQIGRHGASSAGIGLNANGLEAPFGFKLGVPSPYIRRRILDSHTMHDALEAVMEVRQSVCANLVFTHRDGYCVDLETTPERHGVVHPRNGLLTHANVFLGEIPAQIEETYRPGSVDSLWRAPRVESVLRRARDAQTSEEVRTLIATAFSDHFSHPNSVCAHPDPRDGGRWETVASAMVDLTTGEYLVAPGNPCEHAYEPLPWNLYA